MTQYFVSHNDDMNPVSYGKRSVEYGAGLGVNFKDNISHLVGIKAFDNNVSILSSLTYTVNIVAQGQYIISKDEPFTAIVNRTILLLPEKPTMKGRIADPRIGIGTVARDNMTSKVDRSVTEHHMKRWNLEPINVASYRKGEQTLPLQPIVFYLDPSFPLSWREAVRNGVCDWNEAFEAIGFKDAIQVRDFPQSDSTFDPDNLQYNTIRYIPLGVLTTTKDASWCDPRNGQILNGSLFIYHDLLRWNNIQRFLQTSQVDPQARTMRLPDQLMAQTIRCAVRHEVGHMLGLINNMAGSSAIPTDSLRSATFTKVHGITASVMDNVGFNYVAQPTDKAVALDPRIGEYDKYAIRVAYKPIYDVHTTDQETTIVRSWVSEQSGNPYCRFAPEQYLLTTFDPTGLSFDLGDDALKASQYGIDNLKYIINNMDAWLDNEDKDYSYRSTMYTYIVQQLNSYLFNVYRNIGSFYLNESFVGDSLSTITVVPKEIQRASLQFVMNHLKNLRWLDNPDIVKNLDFNGSQAFRILKNYIVKRKNVITDIYQTKRISLTYHRDPSSYSPSEYINDLFEIVWRPTMEGRSLTDEERLMQAEFIANVRNDVDINGKHRWFGQYYAKEEQGLNNFDEEDEKPETVEDKIFGNRWVVSNIAADNNLHLWYESYEKVLKLIRSKCKTGDAQTQAHYDYLLFQSTRSWKDAPKL